MRQLDSLHRDVQIRAAWEAHVSSVKSKLLPPPFDTVARRRLGEPGSESCFLDDALFEPRLMKSLTIRLGAVRLHVLRVCVCILVGKAWRGGNE